MRNFIILAKQDVEDVETGKEVEVIMRDNSKIIIMLDEAYEKKYLNKTSKRE